LDCNAIRFRHHEIAESVGGGFICLTGETLCEIELKSRKVGVDGNGEERRACG
jgi:hypothetical protein